MGSIRKTILLFLLTAAVLFLLFLGLPGRDATPSAQVTEVSTVPETVMETTRETVPETTAPPTETTVPETEPKVVYDTVPRFYQLDYPYEIFSDGTVIDSGCSVTCLAMVASYLTDHEYTPAQMAYHFNIPGLNNVERLEYGNEMMQLPAVRMDDAMKCYQALKEGKVVIAMVNDTSIFTTTAHFIVLAGITEDDKIIINDPMGKIYPEADLYMTTRFQEGFEKYHMFQGFMGAWIYDKKDMPEEPCLYPADLPQQPENRYKGYRLSEEDEDMLAAFLWAAASEEPQEARQAIAEVILNRVVSHNYPYKVRDVIYRGEYRDMTGQMERAKDVGQEFYDAVQAAMFGPYLLPEDVIHFSKWEKGSSVWGTIGSYNFLYARQGGE